MKSMPWLVRNAAGQMKVIAFIEPPQGVVIEKILRHNGLWQPSTPRPPPAEELGSTTRTPPRMARRPHSDAPREMTFVDMDTFWATF